LLILHTREKSAFWFQFRLAYLPFLRCGVGWCHGAVFGAGVVAHGGSSRGLPLCFAVLSEVAAVKEYPS